MRDHFVLSLTSDCQGQAMARMQTRYLAVNPGIRIGESAVDTCGAEAGGNLLDLINALDGEPGGAAGNSAPREQDQSGNGSPICYAEVQDHQWIIGTACSLGLVHKVLPQVEFRQLDTDAYVCVRLERPGCRYNFRGLEVFPYLLRDLRVRFNLDAFTKPFTDFPEVEPCAWHVDTIAGQRRNIKLTALRREFPEFEPGRVASIRVHERSQPYRIACFARLTDIDAAGEIGLYVSSSGYGNDRFLELGVLGGSAAEQLEVSTGDRVEVLSID